MSGWRPKSQKIGFVWVCFPLRMLQTKAQLGLFCHFSLWIFEDLASRGSTGDWRSVAPCGSRATICCCGHGLLFSMISEARPLGEPCGS
jgi:hypothetical protein